MNQLFESTPELTGHLLRCYYCEGRNDALLEYFSQDAVWIGSGEHEIKKGMDEITEYFQAGKGKIPLCNIGEDVYKIIYCGEESCIVNGRLKIYTGEDSTLLMEFFQRVTAVYIIENNQLRLQHMHLSIPDCEMMGGEHFPSAVGARNYEYIQRVLAEHIQAMDMLTINMKSGMKGCLDDEGYTFFFVNEGLAKMLGYTHDEFMRATGGCAVNAVYSLDRAHFLESCRKSLENGIEYSVEYRMEKKDGAQIWVMDTGRKVNSYDGSFLINSVITDITELKEMVFALQTERERYRIALENITDVMFEYDIPADIFISFEKVESEDGQRMEKVEIENFSEIIKMGDVIHPDNETQLMAVFRGQTREKIDVRIRDPQDLAAKTWSWKSVYCSILYDADKRPVRTIGAFRDITKEKEREEKLVHQAQRDSLTGLLNQNAMKVEMKKYLLAKTSQAHYALLIIDLDYFKQVNDTFGHLAGNAALLGVSEKLQKTFRATDLIGRIGGDEFAVVLKDVGLETVIEKCEEILTNIRFVFIGNGNHITCSIGVAFSGSAEEPYDILFGKADKSLYEAKKKGRDGYSLYEEG